MITIAARHLPATDLPRISLVLFVRGFVLLALAAVAVRWPEETLVDAMVTAGAVVGFLAVFELTLALLSAARRDTKALMVLHALMSIAFAGIAISARFAATCTTTALASTWLVLQAALSLTLIPLAGAVRGGRSALFAWSAFNLACGLFAATYSCATVEWLLYLGAVYSAGYGMTQIAVSLWIRRHLRELAAAGTISAA
jgi:hypothetical protein